MYKCVHYLLSLISGIAKSATVQPKESIYIYIYLYISIYIFTLPVPPRTQYHVYESSRMKES